jgi:hypothetical protein
MDLITSLQTDPIAQLIEQTDLHLRTIANGSSTERFQTETYELLDEKYKEHTIVYTDGSRKDGRVPSAIVTPECKRMRSQNTIYSAEQEAIIKTIGTKRKSNKKKVILTGSLSTLMAIEGNGDTPEY